MFDWYGGPCPCGRPPGQCKEHPRARPEQRPPDGEWRTWLALAGRGWGKTRCGAEWVRWLIEHHGKRRVAMIAPTAADARDVMVEGESGLLSICPPWNRPLYEPSKRRLTWPNGAIATTYSADEPERLRGPQHDAAWCDEVCAWRYPKTYDMMLFGLRLGVNPQIMITTTPRPTDLLRKIVASPTTRKTGGSTYDNRLHLASEFFTDVVSVYEGTRLGRQEINAELLEVLDGVWFVNFDPARHVTPMAEYIPGVPVRIAIDAGTSLHTGAVFYQFQEVTKGRYRVNVFGDYYAVDLYSEANARAIQEKSLGMGTPPDRVVLDPAAGQRTGVGPAAMAEYQRVFGPRTTHWPLHPVADGLDQVELMLGGKDREPEILIHPRCQHLITAFNSYVRAEVRGEFTTRPKDPQHPHEELMDSLRGAIRDCLPEGRIPKPVLRRTTGARIF